MFSLFGFVKFERHQFLVENHVSHPLASSRSCLRHTPQGVGAAALVVINSEDDYRLYMAAPSSAMEMPDIPLLIISSSEGEALLDEWDRSTGRSVSSSSKPSFHD